MKNDTYFCPKCRNTLRLESKPRRSFMGFPRIPCPSCKTEFYYPLTTGYIVFYWLLLLGNVADFFGYSATQGYEFVPNPIEIVAQIVALFCILLILVNNVKTKREIAAAQVSAISAAPQVAEYTSSDYARWYHFVLALLVPFIAFPWGVVNLFRKKISSGLWLTIPSGIILLAVAIPWELR